MLWLMAGPPVAGYVMAPQRGASSHPAGGQRLPGAALMNFADEASAKAAWLARSEQDLPSWGLGASVATPSLADYAASVDTVRAAAAQALSGAWLVPGTPVLTLAAADEMSNVALNEAAARGFNPVSVCVLDPSGRVLVSKTMVACPTLAPELSKAKARTCVGFHVSRSERRMNPTPNPNPNPNPNPLTLTLTTCPAGSSRTTTSAPRVAARRCRRR